MKDCKLTIYQNFNIRGELNTTYLLEMLGEKKVSITSQYHIDSKIIQFYTTNCSMEELSFQILNIEIMESITDFLGTKVNLKDRDEVIELMDLVFDIVLNYFDIEKDMIERVG